MFTAIKRFFCKHDWNFEIYYDDNSGVSVVGCDKCGKEAKTTGEAFPNKIPTIR